MSKLLIYIGENQVFDVADAIKTISSISGVSNLRTGRFIGAVFECDYTLNGRTTIVKISEDSETITVEGLGQESLDFALKLQSLLAIPLSAIDMDYNFNVTLSDFESVSDFETAISS